MKKKFKKLVRKLDGVTNADGLVLSSNSYWLKFKEQDRLKILELAKT